MSRSPGSSWMSPSDSISRTGRLWRVTNSRRSSTIESIPSPIESQSPPIYSRPKPQLFALLIGINDYDQIRPLRGAVPDIIAVKEYLESHLKVPQDQIQTLLNRAASRDAIIEGFKQLESGERIKEGDPIFIYFAGHGSEIPDPEGGPAKMQAIVPQNYCERPGDEVPAILDRTIGALLAKIADKKGDNITLVFDCCHSASGTRGEKSNGAWLSVNVRSVRIEPSIHAEDLDSDIWYSGQRGTSISSNHLHGNLSSHMLIAACSSSESAIEINGRGSFSSSFLKLLRSVPPDQLRYADILTRMDAIPHQNPQCEGLNQKRYLFNSRISMHARTCFNITFEQETFVIDGGLVAGVSQGAEFAIHASTDVLLEKPLGTLIVDKLGAFSADLKLPPGAPSFILSQPSIALQTKTGQRKDLRLYVPSHDDLGACHDALIQLMDREHEFDSIDLVDNPDDADFVLAMENANVAFFYRDERILRHGLNRLYKNVVPTPEELAPVLKSAAHFYWKLNRTNNNPEVNSGVQVELYRLLPPKIRRFDDLNGGLSPIGPNLHEGSIMNVVVDTDLNIPYGFKLTNNTSYDLYPYLFYFDLSDFSIVSYYESPSTAKRYTLDVPLPKNGGVLTIGYGAGGAPAQTFVLQTGQQLDVGFLKIFLCTNPVDLSMMAQASPFESTRSGEQIAKPREEAWGTMLIPLLQFPSDPASIQRIQEENIAHEQKSNNTREIYQLREEPQQEQRQESTEILPATRPNEMPGQRQISHDLLPEVEPLSSSETAQSDFGSWLWTLWSNWGDIFSGP
ncbi:hypothetical protein M413DRAFT_410348 [Hebeloma cylindrosporum]|uniref:Peptidase C14 caspase domain-containing protein n=1 Tax=Hebeloma cylindrosporum TaxID=76867 RepID=A0A0C3BZ90_HEBCY|nr:hypothetical protein M413DRAFT_410348 [Hebeloma cylindrosporum h7]